MKKVLLVVTLSLILFLSGCMNCDMEPTPSGVIVSIADCEYAEEREYYIDVVVEKSTTNPLAYTETVDVDNINYVWETESDLLPLPYQDFNNEYISVLGYDLIYEQSFGENCYFRYIPTYIEDETDIDPYYFENFKIVIIDTDFNVVFTSDTYSSELLPNPENDIYWTFVYYPGSDSMTTVGYDMFISEPESCGMDLGAIMLIVFAVFLFIALFGLALSEPFVLRSMGYNIYSTITSFVASLLVIFASFSDAYMSANTIIITFVIGTTVQLTKFLLVRHFERNADKKQPQVRALVGYTVTLALYPVIIFALFNIVF